MENLHKLRGMSFSKMSTLELQGLSMVKSHKCIKSLFIVLGSSRHRRSLRPNDVWHFNISSIIPDTGVDSVDVVEASELTLTLTSEARGGEEVVVSQMMEIEDTKVLLERTVLKEGDIRMTFDVTRPVDGWVGGGAVNKGLKIECSDGLVVKHARLDTKVVEMKDVKHTIHKRSTKPRVRNRSNKDRCMKGSKRRSRCCKRKMKVKFSELEVFDFIYQPTEFNAAVCQGRCPIR